MLGIPSLEVCDILTQMIHPVEAARDLSAAMRADELALPELSTTRSRSHAVGVLAAYGYQGVGAGFVGINLLMRGYGLSEADLSFCGVDVSDLAGTLAAGAGLGVAVGVQHFLLGANALQVVSRYPNACQSIRDRFPRTIASVNSVWAANDGGIALARTTSIAGIQSYIYNTTFTENPPPDQLRRRSIRAGAASTLFSATIGSAITGTGLSLQAAARALPWDWLASGSAFFTEQVVQHPNRTATCITGLLFSVTLGNGIKSLRQDRRAKPIANP